MQTQKLFLALWNMQTQKLIFPLSYPFDHADTKTHSHFFSHPLEHADTKTLSLSLSRPVEHAGTETQFVS